MQVPSISAFVLSLLAVVALADAPPTQWDFEDATEGRLPKGWSAAKTGEGAGSVWKVVDDPTAPKKSKVVAQMAEGPGALFNLCVAENSAYKNVEVSVSLKAMKGKIDQGGGLVWRYSDSENYYVARFNPLESNFRLYKVIQGKRTQLASRDNLEGAAGSWQRMSVAMKGDLIECTLDGKKLLEAKDGTFKNVGKIGLWTKADAQTVFDDLEAKELN